MSKWFFIRHGQSKFNAALTDEFNSELTYKGMEQSAQVAPYVISLLKDPTGFVSPYMRCLQTAAYFKIPLKVTPDIGESPEELHKDVDKRIRNNKVQFPRYDWSDYPEVYDYARDDYTERLKRFVSSLPSDKDVVVISHMTPITHMLDIIHGSSGNWGKIGNCSMSLVEDGKVVYTGRTAPSLMTY